MEGSSKEHTEVDIITVLEFWIIRIDLLLR